MWIASSGRVLVELSAWSSATPGPTRTKQIKGGIAERESADPVSNVMVLTAGGVPTRIGYQSRRHGRRRRGGRGSRAKAAKTLDKK